jgi:hypothetical protein
MKQKYIEKRFNEEKRALVAMCDKILREYIDAGYRITVRTLYYQLVSRDIIPNVERSYKNLTVLVNDARMAGLLDWDVIEDRGRRPIVRARWSSGASILQACVSSYHMDMWKPQSERVFVVVEKDALAGVLEDKCHEFDVPLLAAKGYPSVSAVRDLVHKEIFPHIFPAWKGRGNPGKAANPAQRIVFLHMGDHDPSGKDMSRDLEERLRIFSEGAFHLKFKRIALNMDQVEELNPPPNPAKVTDSRFIEYQKEFGDESWELDALPPDYLNNLLDENIREHLDSDLWEERVEEITGVKNKLASLAKEF